MRKLITIAALAAAVMSSPVFAVTAAQAAAHEWVTQTQRQETSAYSSNPAFDVYDNHGYVGSDPDPRTRAMMQDEDKGRA
jgi:hypothetical protein